MGIYTEPTIVLGIRLLRVDEYGDCYVVKECTGTTWKEEAKQCLQLPYTKIQTLHPCSTSYENEPKKEKEGEGNKMWCDNLTSLEVLLM